MMRRAPALLLAVVLGIAGCGRPQGRDVLLITLDTFRADRIGVYGHRGELTPHLDRLARDGVVFDSASAVTPITLPSHASILTGRYPTATGVRNNGTFVLPDPETTLAEILREAGWSTAAVIASFPVTSRYGVSQGFDTFDEALPPSRSGPGQPMPLFFAERDARSVTDRALDVWQRMERRPRFGWVHYFDAHAPYAAPDPWGSRHADSPYDGEIAFVDAEVGRLVDRVRADAPDTVIVVVGDHGESLGEHGEKTHGVFVYESTIHVPFLLVAPGRLPAGTHVGVPVSQVDIVPTLLGLLGVNSPSGIEGSDLRETIASGRVPSRPVYAESYLPRLQFRFSELTMLRRGPLKYIDAPSPEIYDLAQDPEEQRNLAGGHPDEGMLADALSTFRGSADHSASERAAGGLDPDAEARLRSLGYTSAGTLRRSEDEGRGRDPKAMIQYLQRYDRAVGLAASGRYEEGVAELRTLIPEAPENFMVRYQLAAALFGERRFEEAAEELGPVISAAPEFFNGHLMLAEVLSRLGRLDEALRSYDAAAATAPGLAAPLLARGQLLESLGRFGEAAAAYRDALSRAPDDREIPLRLIDLHAGRGDLDAAVADLRTFADRHPGLPGPWVGLAVALRRKGDDASAREAVDRALAMDPKRADALVLSADLLLEAGHAAQSLALYDQVLAAGSQRPEALLGRARSLLELGRTVEADAVLARAQQIPPQTAAALCLKGLYFERLRDPVRAAAAYRRALALEPSDTTARAGLARVSGGGAPLGVPER